MIQESFFQISDEKDKIIIQNVVVKKAKKSVCRKWTNGLSDNDYGVATLSKSHITILKSSCKV